MEVHRITYTILSCTVVVEEEAVGRGMGVLALLVVQVLKYGLAVMITLGFKPTFRGREAYARLRLVLHGQEMRIASVLMPEGILSHYRVFERDYYLITFEERGC